MRLYLIRHADPDYSIDGLTPHGHKEAQALAQRMSSVGLDRIYASPLGRAQLTAKYSAEATGLPITTLPWTTELGHWRVQEEGIGSTCVWDIHGQTVRRLSAYPTPQTWHEHAPMDNPGFKADYEKVCAASDDFFDRLGYRHEAGVYKVHAANTLKIAVYCHGGLGLTWLSHLLNIPLPIMWAGFFLHPSSVTTVLFDERMPGTAVPRCIGMGDLSHLHAAGLEPRPSGIRANYW